MKGFIEWLEEISTKDSKVRAVLRRSLSFAPGQFPAAFPYVEPFLSAETGKNRRFAFYLVAGLWALHLRDRLKVGIPIGQACAFHQKLSKSTSTERRFITLLDSDWDQLPQRLRQMVSLLKAYDLGFDSLLQGLLHWTSEDRWIQIQWARDFYRNLETESHLQTHKQEKSL